jgi:capping protein beta
MPLEIAMDEKEGKEFLQCEYNKDGDPYRSPWSNQYYPEIIVEEGEE